MRECNSIPPGCQLFFPSVKNCAAETKNTACRHDLKNAGEVYAIYILKEYCGQGVGQALMNHSLEAMREYEKAAVWVLEENQRAIHFYRKCGFREDGMKKVLNLGTPVSEIRMMTEL